MKFGYSAAALVVPMALALSACAETDVEDDATANADETSVAADAMPADRPDMLGEGGALPELAEGYSRYNCESGDVTMWVDVAEDGMQAHSGMAMYGDNFPDSDGKITYTQYGAIEGANPEGGSAKTYLESSDGDRLEFEDNGVSVTEAGADEATSCTA